VVQDRWLVYGKLGGGWVHSSAEVNAFGQSWNGSSTKDGWLVGAGLEYGFKSRWTINLEYEFIGLASWNSATVPAVALNRDVQLVKAGINYKFESGISDSPRQAAGILATLRKMKIWRRNRRIRSRISSAFRSKAIPISTPGRSTARRKY
jgi:hypothetical protein